jgi:hypothetical protein
MQDIWNITVFHIVSIYLQAKIDNTKKTGTGGGKEAKLNEIYHKVLDIIGEHSFFIRHNLANCSKSCDKITDLLQSSV